MHKGANNIILQGLSACSLDYLGASATQESDKKIKKATNLDYIGALVTFKQDHY